MAPRAPLPRIYESGSDPAYKILSISIFFTKPPAASIKATLAEATPSPLRAYGRWVDSMLYGGTEEWPEADWPVFWSDIEQWLRACADTGLVHFALVSAPLECKGFTEALERGTACATDVLVPHITAMLRSGKIPAKDETLLNNLAFGVGIKAAGELDEDKAALLSPRDRKSIAALAVAAIEGDPGGSTKYWIESVLAIVAPDHPLANMKTTPKKRAAVKKKAVKKVAKRPASARRQTMVKAGTRAFANRSGRGTCAIEGTGIYHGTTYKWCKKTAGAKAFTWP